MSNKQLPVPAATSSFADDFRAVMHQRLGQAAMFALASGAIWYYLVQPIEKSYAAKLQEREAIKSRIERFTNDGTPGEDFRGQAVSLDKRLANILAWTSASSDPRGLYDAITRLAAAHGVQLERIEPTAGQTINATSVSAPAVDMPRSRRGRAAVAKTAISTTWTGRTVGHRLTISGTYAQIADFIASCETDLGASKVVSFRFRSDAFDESRPGVIEATLETIHLALVPPTVAKSTTAPPSKPAADAILDLPPLSNSTKFDNAESSPLEGSPR